MDMIKIRIVTKDWTQGEWCGFRLMLKEGCSAIIDWGDGKSTKSGRESGWNTYDHVYGEKRVPYSIIISAEEDGGIIGFDGGGFFEVHTDEVDLRHCPNLLYLGYSGDEMCGVDVSHNVLLQKLFWHGLAGETQDFSANTELQTLDLNNSKELRLLNISKCDKLEVLNVAFCQNLQRIAISNRSALKDVELLFTSLNQKSQTFIEKVVVANQGIMRKEVYYESL